MKVSHEKPKMKKCLRYCVHICRYPLVCTKSSLMWKGLISSHISGPQFVIREARTELKGGRWMQEPWEKTVYWLAPSDLWLALWELGSPVSTSIQDGAHRHAHSTVWSSGYLSWGTLLPCHFHLYQDVTAKGHQHTQKMGGALLFKILHSILCFSSCY